MPVVIEPYPAPNGDSAPWLVAYPPFPRPQNAAQEAPLHDPPWSSPADPKLSWPVSAMLGLILSDLPGAGMPLRSQPGYAGHVSPAVAAEQDRLLRDIRYRYSLLETAKVAFVYEQALHAAQMARKMGGVRGNPVVVNLPDYLPSSPAQHRGLDTTGLDTYKCYDKSPGPFDSTVQYIRRHRGHQAALNQAHAYYRERLLLPQAHRASLAQGVATGA